MKKVVVLLVLLGLLAGGYYYYRRLAAGPTYALMQAARAFKSHDVAAFEQYVDVRSVSSSLINQVADQGAALGLPSSNNLLLQGALQVLKPQLSEIARQEVQQLVASGAAPSPDKMPSTPLGKISVLGAVGNVIGSNSQFKGISYVRQEGEEALVGLELDQPKYDTTVVVELKMLHEGDHWQVKEIANARELVKRLAQLKKGN
ncbi:DUF2939 domain-containing protein [Hymenobacter sp. GOD-10R]|uniref:DUF2939 domain-containing protein n=1 Tax=Hymenobacter sp. GOD-10R TaxID=3093922 RepID=UPI002D799123|nr:DUF2939 domain-containing protein [Hymenobacter sp. GOD-10R]WRQ28586.1 DUF2939 domain-containing protein [Hymenobacter sp. GOD-10R]